MTRIYSCFRNNHLFNTSVLNDFFKKIIDFKLMFILWYKYGLQSCWTNCFSLMSLILFLRILLNYLYTKYVSKFLWFCLFVFVCFCLFVLIKYPRIKNFKVRLRVGVRKSCSRSVTDKFDLKHLHIC